MGELFRYKCKECGFSEYTTEDGGYSLMREYGRFYSCPRCKHLFTRVWAYSDIEQAVADYSFDKDEFLADILMNAISKDYHELFRKDVLWFQHEVKKGNDSRYYRGVVWTKEAFIKRFFLFLKRRKYAESIDFNEIKKTIGDPNFEKNAAHYLLFKKERCNNCGELARMWRPKDGCPKCGNSMELCFVTSNNEKFSIPESILID